MDFFIDQLSVWEKLKSTTEPIVMYGTGNGADKMLDALEEMNIKISGVTASNSFVRKRTFRGFQVMPLSYFEEIYESFTIIITFGTSIPEVMENIYSIAQKHTVLVPVVPVIGTQIFDRAFLEAHKTEINLAYSLMADDFSKKIFAGYVSFLFGGELSTLQSIETPQDEAFENILKLGNNETYVDIGAYRGDTVDSFLGYTNGKYANIICAEPDTKTYNKLLEHCSHLENFRAVNCAVTDVDGNVYFSNLHGRQSSLGGDTLTPSATLGTLIGQYSPTYIKIDSEGCENEILKAGANVLREHKPKLNVATYHKCEDIFTLPILINSINPDYKIHLRHHPYIPAWDTLFYCV